MPRRSHWIAPLGVGLVLALGCAPVPDPPGARNVVLISIDTLRADHLGAYGHARDTSPNLDAFAARGVLFEDVTSTAPWTLPAHASMLTGLYPSRHGVRTHLQRLPADVPALAEWLAQRGFETAAFVNAYFMEERFGLARGFQRYEVFPEDQSREGATQRVLAAARAWLDARGPERFLLLVHLFDAHSSYQSQPRYERMFTTGTQRYSGDTMEIMMGIHGDVPLEPADAEHLSRLYDAGIRQLDDPLGRFLAGLDPDTLVLVTSDHGEEFLEHGGMIHGSSHYQEALRVPLLLVGPTLPAGRRVTAPASLVDLLPTVLDLLAIEPPPDLDGISLRPYWESGEREPTRALLAETGPMEEDGLRSLRRGAFKLIEDRRSGERHLFDLSTDPLEREDLALSRPELASSMAAELAERTRSQRTPDPIAAPTPAEQERLRSLGYLDP